MTSVFQEAKLVMRIITFFSTATFVIYFPSCNAKITREGFVTSFTFLLMDLLPILVDNLIVNLKSYLSPVEAL